MEVLSKGSRGIFGIGSEPARVRITLEPARKSATQEEQRDADCGISAADAPPQHQTLLRPRQPTMPGSDTTHRPRRHQPSTERSRRGDGAKWRRDESEDERPEPKAAAVRTLRRRTRRRWPLRCCPRLFASWGSSASVVTSWRTSDDDDGRPICLLDIEGDDLGALIGRRGETLASLQYLVRLMVNQRIKQWANIVVDVENYKERREAQLTQLALRMADQVAESGRAQALEPMPANERRLIHIALRDHPLVYTQSSGEDERRKVNIVPRDTLQSVTLTPCPRAYEPPTEQPRPVGRGVPFAKTLSSRRPCALLPSWRNLHCPRARIDNRMVCDHQRLPDPKSTLTAPPIRLTRTDQKC